MGTESRTDKSKHALRVLLMDDEQMIRDVTSAMLKKLGFSSETAETGQQAVAMYEEAIAKQDPFDLLILDLTIPDGMGGIEALKQILAIDPQAKAILSSGYSTGSDASEYMDLGFKGIIAKPFRTVNLRDITQAVLNENE